MTMAEFRSKYGHQASGLRMQIDELISRARFNPETITDGLIQSINNGMEELQEAMLNKNLSKWYLD